MVVIWSWYVSGNKITPTCTPQHGNWWMKAHAFYQLQLYGSEPSQRGILSSLDMLASNKRRSAQQRLHNWRPPPSSCHSLLGNQHPVGGRIKPMSPSSANEDIGAPQPEPAQSPSPMSCSSPSPAFINSALWRSENMSPFLWRVIRRLFGQFSLFESPNAPKVLSHYVPLCVCLSLSQNCYIHW